MNKEAFAWGRLAAHGACTITSARWKRRNPETFEQKQARRIAFLTDYQDAAWAERYRRLVDQVGRVRKAKIRNSTVLTEAVAQGFFKADVLLGRIRSGASVHEWRVLQKLERQFDGDYTLTFHMAPPLAAAAIDRPAIAEDDLRAVDDARHTVCWQASKGLRGGASTFSARTGRASHGAPDDRRI